MKDPAEISLLEIVEEMNRLSEENLKLMGIEPEKSDKPVEVKE